MSIQNALNTAVYSRLSGGTALTALLSSTTSVYFLQAPDECTDTNYVVFSYQAGRDENLTPGRMKNTVLNIRAISTTSAAIAGSIDAQIDALMHGKQLTVAGWANFWIARENDFSMIENSDNNKKYWTSGGLYRIRLDES